jgi:predicted AlkP superfamily phosphohydrolase/phosphomutase
LRKDNRFVPLFSDILNKKDEKYDILKKAFFFDVHLMKCIRQHWQDSRIDYSIVRFPGLGIISRYFYQYHDPEIGGNISESDIKKYGLVIEKYYEYYDSIIGNLISTTGDNELLVILSFFEYEPLPVWRRILVNLVDQKDIYVYKSLHSQGTILLYEKNAMKKDYPLKAISIYDIYPTLLYYAGFQLSKDLEGEVIREIFTDEFVLNNPIDIDTNYKRFTQ